MANNIDNLEYKINAALADDLHTHLSNCSGSFTPELSERVNIATYAAKIAANAVTFEAWDDRSLIGLIAAYFNDDAHICGYITSVSVYRDYKGKGLASTLLRQCITYGKKNDFKEIFLEVNKLNFAAIQLYKKYNFEQKNKQGDYVVMHLVLNNSNGNFDK
ncbi:GNAT family N-acetyltransferase [Mucilaginibacter flavidus]|uniref:GNAT family N-acetyltransferase n=1 Tax=Mucilaginibacter flavidus TaxID=2949309 RepID=UPI002092275E|nr:GNAT family N-acetyltransferase [Mucilaginibacter flavidus]MCO5947238.1 GNAT family N-acetyltransferase [Mucilaginibacter flavidus]